MSTTIGEVNINLRMSLAQFKQDVRSGSDEASRGAKQIASDVSGSSREAVGSLALIGEEIGVHIPRHIRTFIADIPGVGAALSSAFTGVAIIALIEVIAKIIEKIQAYKEHIAATAEAWDKANQTGINAIRDLDIQILQLQEHLDDLAGKHMAAVVDALKLIDAQTLKGIGDEFQRLGKGAEDAFKKMQVGWAASMIGLGNDKGVKIVADSFAAMLKQIQELQNAGDEAGIGAVVDKQVAAVQKSLDQIKEFHGEETAGGKAIADALRDELQELTNMQTVYTKLNEIADDKKQVKTLEETAAAAKKAAEEAKKLADELNKAMDFLDKHKGAGRTVSKGGTNPFALPDPNVDSSGLLGLKIGGQSNQTPLYGGTKEAKDQLDLLTNQNTQLQMASELYDATRNSSEKYTNEVQALNTLLATGAIDQDTYNRAMSEAKNKYDDVTKGLQQIGDRMGQDIAQAALFGGSWVSAFKDIAAEIVKTIVQMTILKSLQNATAAAGGGGPLGFFTSLLGGLTHHATGGSVVAGQGYLVGENGPEPFIPSTAGTIIPNEAMRGGRGGETHVHHNEFHFYGVQDADSFRKSQSQIAADMAAQLGRHVKRNG